MYIPMLELYLYNIQGFNNISDPNHPQKKTNFFYLNKVGTPWERLDLWMAPAP